MLYYSGTGCSTLMFSDRTDGRGRLSHVFAVGCFECCKNIAMHSVGGWQHSACAACAGMQSDQGARGDPHAAMLTSLQSTAH
jgi:hypothetical protein